MSEWYEAPMSGDDKPVVRFWLRVKVKGGPGGVIRATVPIRPVRVGFRVSAGKREVVA